MNDSEKLLAESYEYIDALRQVGHKCITSPSDLLANAAYVYLSRWQRVKLGVRIILRIFRK